MKENNLKLEQLDLSFLPKGLAGERREQLKKALEGIKKIKWPIKAVVLGGGYKHKELTYNQKSLGSDIDLFVFSNFIPFFWKKLLKIQEEINQPVHFFHYRGVIPLFLRKSKTFWAYRLKQEGIVLEGDKEILRKIKAREDNIPKIEALRILFQTLVVWLCLAQLNSEKSKRNIDKFTILRSYLNIGESYLTFAGKLAPSYRERLNKIDEVAQEFNLKRDLVEKIKLGYKTKIAPLEMEEHEFSLLQVKKDCLEAINHLLSIYLKTNASLEEKLDFLGKEIRPKYLFNLAFFYFLRNIKGIRPKLFPAVFKYKITDLWKMVVYSEMGEKEKLFEILEKYFKVQKFSDETLIKIFEAHPSFSTVEIT